MQLTVIAHAQLEATRIIPDLRLDARELLDPAGAGAAHIAAAAAASMSISTVRLRRSRNAKTSGSWCIAPR